MMSHPLDGEPQGQISGRNDPFGGDSQDPDGAPRPEELLARLRGLCLLLPEVAEVDLLDNPAFRVATITFVVFEHVDERPTITVKCRLHEQAALIRREGFEADAETGHHGWTSIQLDSEPDWEQLDELVVASYRLLAPDHCIEQLDRLVGDA